MPTSDIALSLVVATAWANWLAWVGSVGSTTPAGSYSARACWGSSLSMPPK
jgi:hypothetical protein